jgi:predicted ATPase
LMHEIGVKHHIPMGVGLGLTYLNWARLWDDPTNFSFEEMMRGNALSQQTGGGLGVANFEYMRAEVLLKFGRRSEAASVLDEALPKSEQYGQGMMRAELLRLRGLLHQYDGAVDTAENCFRQSQEVAEEQGARLFQLRTATDLARLYLDLGAPAKARTVLEPLYTSFDQGFDTSDLLAAKSVLGRCMID